VYVGAPVQCFAWGPIVLSRQSCLVTAIYWILMMITNSWYGFTSVFKGRSVDGEIKDKRVLYHFWKAII